MIYDIYDDIKKLKNNFQLNIFWFTPAWTKITI